MADALKEQIKGLIENCKTVIKAKGNELPDIPTIQVADAMLEEAKKRVPDNPVLKGLTFKGTAVTWTSILTVLTAALNAIPNA